MAVGTRGSRAAELRASTAARHQGCGTSGLLGYEVAELWDCRASVMRGSVVAGLPSFGAAKLQSCWIVGSPGFGTVKLQECGKVGRGREEGTALDGLGSRVWE